MPVESKNIAGVLVIAFTRVMHTNATRTNVKAKAQWIFLYSLLIVEVEAPGESRLGCGKCPRCFESVA